MSQNLRLTGTPIAEAPKRRLQAGALRATFDAGTLRWITWKDIEVLRAVMFLVRTPGWGTPAARIHHLDIVTGRDAFHISYDARFDAAEGEVQVSVKIDGYDTGKINASAHIQVAQPVATNRTGFVILHPLDGFVGSEVEVVHASGAISNLVIPVPISPAQPIMDIRAITHCPRRGLRVTTRFEGDTFEMEDHRNWSDASFKTYSRPIDLPYPWLLRPEEPIVQSIQMSIVDSGTAQPVSSAVQVPEVNGQRLPRYALPLDSPGAAQEALAFADRLAALAPARLLLRYDAGRDEHAGADTFQALARLLEQTGAQLEVQAILPGADDASAAAELAALAQRLREARITVAEIAVFAKIDERSFQPGEARPPHPSSAQLARLTRHYFPTARCGGGTPAFFTELNRNRPDPALIDYLTFATAPSVHAADDASVMETLQSLPHLLYSAHLLSGDRPLAIGPVGIGGRLNPYGPGVTDNDPNARVGMAAHDPRQRGLYAAAWHVGYFARLAPWAVERFAFGAPTGPFGLLASKQPWRRQGWDQQPGWQLYPLYHVARWISRAAGGRLLSAATQEGIAHVEWEKNGTRHGLLANLTPDIHEAVPLPPGYASGQLLDERWFLQAVSDQGAWPRLAPLPEQFQLLAWAVLYLNGE